MITFKVFEKGTNEYALMDVYMDEDGEFYEIEERVWSYNGYMHKVKIDKEKYDVFLYKNGIEIK